jgi:hypothetical protein
MYRARPINKLRGQVHHRVPEGGVFRVQKNWKIFSVLEHFSITLIKKYIGKSYRYKRYTGILTDVPSPTNQQT